MRIFKEGNSELDLRNQLIRVILVFRLRFRRDLLVRGSRIVA